MLSISTDTPCASSVSEISVDQGQMYLAETDTDGLYLVYLVHNMTEELIASFEVEQDMLDFLWNLAADAEAWLC